MKRKDFTIYAAPLWLGMLLEQQEERCQRELKMESKEYNEILEEIGKIMKKYPFMEATADNDESEGTLMLSEEEIKAFTRFLLLESERRDWEGIQMYLMGCCDTLEILQLLKII